MTDSFHDRNIHAQVKIDALTKESILETLDTMNKLRGQKEVLSIQKEIDLLTSHAETFPNEKKRNALKMEVDLAEQEHKCKKQKLEHDVHLLELEKERAILKFEIEKLRFTHASDLIQAELSLYEKELARKEWSVQKAQRLQNPLDGNAIVLSDRCISLEGTIIYSTADYINTRINYYNNQSSTDPIFLVIGSSPGGSVMAGLEILAHIENSIAPVYTIIKSYAASMAAVIATRTNSYMLKDARILHHQMWTITLGNLTTHDERLRYLRELSTRTDVPMLERINGRLAKLGVDKVWTCEEWTREINSKDSTHCWMVHGDEAYKLGWVENTVASIRVTSQVRHPDAKYSLQTITPAPPAPPLPAKCELQALLPGDHYAIVPTQ